MDAITSLQSLGLTPIEALSYTYLVANPSATGYRVARGIGKPTANVYRALESLERKGAVVRDRTATPLFRALPPEDLLGQLEREFVMRRSSASRELAILRADEADERLYSLGSIDHVMSRARILLAAARRIVLADAPADVVESIAEEVRDARARGTRVVVIARGATDGEPSGKHGDTWVEEGSRRGDGHALRMVADAREALLASFTLDAKRVRDAVWTRSALFCATIHDALTTELFFLQVARGASDGLSVDEVERAFEKCREIRGGSGA